MNALQLHAPPEVAKMGASNGLPKGAEALLIVNADDWGGFPAGTDAIERCFKAGSISSSTAMMFMADSARARDIAVFGSRPIGLHLNLTQPYDSAPDEVRERQLRAMPHFADLSSRRWRLDPRPSTRAVLRDVIADQLEEFRRLYGHEPTHLDSHHHVHVSPDVLLVLPRDLPVRQTLSAPPGQRMLARSLKRAFIARRFRTTDELWAFDHIHPALGGCEFGPALEQARGQTVEIICHPSFDEELGLLLSDGWRDALGGLPLGSYLDLPSD